LIPADCAKELKESNVAMVSLWPGPVQTEYMKENIISSNSESSFNIWLASY
jgi:hypothetical protein